MSIVVTITDRGQITIPASIRKLLELSAGKKVVISHHNNIVKIHPLPETIDIMDLYGSIKPSKMSIDDALSSSKKARAEKTATQKYEE